MEKEEEEKEKEEEGFDPIRLRGKMMGMVTH